MTTEAGLSRLIARNLPRQIMAVIAGGGGEARLVGGVVRDVLNGSDPEAATDFDMAVNLPPDQCKALLETAGFHVIPTGIDHGTITVVDHKQGGVRAEVTSLRADIRTDGRHAEVVFGTDWLEDARRRDFTINTMYLAATGEVFDPFDGRADLAGRKVRFVGDAETRITEDYLRMLRFFRFHARFGSAAPDPNAMAAIRRNAEGLGRISGERIAQEMRGILTASCPGTIAALVSTGLDRMIAEGGFNTDGFDRLLPYMPKLSPMHCLGFLLRGQDHEATAERLRLSRKENMLLRLATNPPPPAPLADENWAAVAYDLTRDGGITPPLLAGLYAVAAAAADDVDAAVFDRLYCWQRPQFPVNGDDLIARGVTQGRELGRMLQQLERHWIASDFCAGRDALMKMLDADEMNG